MHEDPVASKSWPSRRVERICLLIVAVATAWFTFVSIYGIGQIPSGGHIGAGHAGTAMMAERIAQWKTPYPSWGWFAATAPTPLQAYCHHPFGMYWVLLPFIAVFGHADFVPPLPAVLMSIATPWLLFCIGRRAWGPIAGAASAVAFVVVPIAVGFANFNNLEVLCIFGTLLFFYGTTCVESTRGRGHLAFSAAGVFVAASGDWVGFVGVGFVLGVYLVTRFLLPKLTPRALRGRVFETRGTRYWAVCSAVAVFSLLLWVALFQKVDLLGDWLASGTVRSSGNKVPLAEVLKDRASWIDFSFTPWVIFLGKLMLPVCVLRMLIRRRLSETLAPAMWLVAAVQYVAFKQGADVHIFWPHYFAPYFALAMGAAAATVHDLLTFAFRNAPRRRLTIAASLLMGVGLPSIAFPDAVRSLRIWRETGGRFNDRGHFIRNNQDILYAIKEEMRPLAREGLRTEAHGSALWGWEHDWALAHPMAHNNAGLPAGDGTAAVWIARASGLSGEEQRKIVSAASVTSFGDVWLVDRRVRTPGIVAWNKGEHDPSPLEALWYGGYVPAHQSAKAIDEGASWEWRVHLGATAPAPSLPPASDRDLEGLRIRHNLARHEGRTEEAERLKAQLYGKLQSGARRVFSDGLVLAGSRSGIGAEQRIEVWFEVPAGYAKNFEIDVTATVIAKNPWSLFPKDPTPKAVMARAPLPTSLWRGGFIYVWSFPSMHRVGREAYTVRFRSNDNAPAPSTAPVVVAEMN
ncbi:MAG: hypothetical protein HOO96_02235 [Polyangiaceae bacterium]|nr:hypothetical protein [Polyangiaceae bacterium]